MPVRNNNSLKIKWSIDQTQTDKEENEQEGKKEEQQKRVKLTMNEIREEVDSKNDGGRR